MNNEMKDLYKGINPIYESMFSSMTEDKERGVNKNSGSVDAISLISTTLNTFFSILLNSKMENAKTERGFQEIKNKILGTTNFGAFRQYLISVVDSLAAMDVPQREAYQSNLQFITSTLAQAEPQLADNKVFDSIKKTTIAKLLDNFVADLEEREVQLKKTNPKLFGEVIKQGLVVKEEKRSGEDTDVEDAEFRGKAFNKSKESLDAASAFVGMVSRDKYVAILKDNADVKRYEDIANNLYKSAQDLQMTDRRGLRNIVTPSGEYKRNDYVRKQDSLLNDIIRQKKEYERIKAGALKMGGLIVPPPVIPICPPEHVWDSSKGICVQIKTTTPEKTNTDDGKKPVVVGNCSFPISIGTKCNEVGKLQSHIINIIPSVNAYLSKKGGADKKYGKGTAAVSNIIWGYLSGNTGQELTSSLTKEMYDAILALTADDIDLTTSAIIGSAIKDNKNWEMSISQKIQEREEIKGAPILSFEDFYSVIEESYNFKKIDEAGVGIGNDGPPPIDAKMKNTAAKKLKDSCIKDSIAQGKVLPCVGGAKDETEKKDEDEGTKPPTREEWKGLKYVNSGSYPVSFDESMLSFWTKEIALTAATFLLPGSGLIVKAGSTGLRSLSIKGASRVGAEKLAQKLAGEGAVKTIGARAGAIGPQMSSIAARLASTKTPKGIANQLSNISSGFFARYKKIPMPRRLANGAMGATLGASAMDFLSGRDSFIIEILEGYIDKGILLNTATGLVNTLDGYVSDDDWATISTVCSVIKGAWTIEDGQAISAWGYIKSQYENKEGESLTADIKSVTAKMGDVEGFPKLRSASPLSEVSEMDWDFAKTELISFVDKLDSNEGALKGNLAKLPKDYIEAFENGDFAEYDEEGNIEGIDTEKESEED